MLERTYLTFRERRARLIRWTVASVAVIGIALLMAPIDRALYPVLRIESVRSEDWHQLLRQVGYIPTWLIVGLMFWLIDRNAPPDGRLEIATSWPARPTHHRAGLVVLAAVCAGVVAEMLKLLIGRSRPDATGAMVWLERPLVLIGDHGGIGYGIPSSHASTAFGGAVMVALLVPAIRWPAVLLAAGCGLSRLNAGAHALSDVLLGAVIGWAVAHLLFRAGQGVRRGRGGGLVPLARP
jgi:membrane-associated phospholipid phosphatase